MDLILQNMEYLNRLEEVSSEFDQMIRALRGGEADRQQKVRHWIVTWLLLPLTSIWDLKGVFKKKTVNFAPAIPITAGTVLVPIITFLTGIVWWKLLIALLIVGYLISFIFIAPRTMCTFNSGYFRIAAYASFRKQEYDLFHRTLLHDKETFYFTPIYEYVKLLATKDTSAKEHVELIHNRIDTFLQQEKSEYLSEIKSLKDNFREKEKELKQAIKDYDNELQLLFDDSNNLHLGIKHIVEFLKATNTALYRKKNKCFNIADITHMLSCGITIYELDDQTKVLKKKYDEGTSGASPQEIPLSSRFATARVINLKTVEEIDEPSTGRFVVSRRFDMGYDKIWVVNFHMDESQEKPLFLTVSNHILDTNEVMRMIHSMLLLKQEVDEMKGVS